MSMRTAMLKINDPNHASPGQQRHREKCFVAVLRQFVEQPEAGILGGVLSYGDWLSMLRHPARNALTHTQLEAVYNFRMRSFRCPENQFFSLEHVNQTGIALHQCGCEVDKAG